MNRYIFWCGILAVCIACIMIIVLSNSYNTYDISDGVIRFHVIANSDSPEDQALKLTIRDRILDEMKQKLAYSTDVEHSRDIIKDNLKNIEDISQQEVERCGKHYDVKACLGEFIFPAKTYGNLSFPAGKYQALKVIIGEGKGKNWWCVMFPPLCFVDISNGVASEQSTHQVQDVLDETDIKHNDQIQLDFKIVEWWNNSKTRLAKMFSFLISDEN